MFAKIMATRKSHNKGEIIGLGLTNSVTVVAILT
jgi:hypothetical protein